RLSGHANDSYSRNQASGISHYSDHAWTKSTANVSLRATSGCASRRHAHSRLTINIAGTDASEVNARSGGSGGVAAAGPRTSRAHAKPATASASVPSTTPLIRLNRWNNP